MNKKIAKKIGDNISYYLGKNEMTQIDLAVKSNIIAPTISLYCCGKRIPGVANLLKIANVFNVSANDLLKGVKV